MGFENDKPREEELEEWRREPETLIIPVEKNERGFDSIVPPSINLEKLAEEERRNQEAFWGPQVGEA